MGFEVAQSHSLLFVVSRGGETVYRIVGFEVDPRSISLESLQLKSGKKLSSVKDTEVEGGGANCLFPKDVEIAELHKGSELWIHTLTCACTP